MSVIPSPYQNWSIKALGGVIVNAPQKVLLVGQQGSGASATPGDIVSNINNEGEESELFGARSMLTTMCKAFKRINQLSQLDCLPLEDPTTAPAAATATLTFAGTATASGNISIAIQSERFYTFTVGVSVNDTAATVAANFNAVVAANTEVLVTSGVVSDVVTLTAVHPGLDGNTLKTRIISRVPGVTVTSTAFTGGAGAVADIDFAAVIKERRYQGIVIPGVYSTNLTALSNYLTNVYNSQYQVKDGVGFTYINSADETSATAFANLFNNKSLVVFSDEIEATTSHKGGYLLEYNNFITTEFAAGRALRLTPNANIAQYLVGNSIANTIGGAFRAALPYHQTPFVDFALVENGAGWSLADQQILLNNGVSFFGNDTTNSRVVVSDVVTTYRDSDKAFQYLNAVDTISQVREFFFNNCQAQFAQSVLTDGDLTGGNTINNPGSIRVYMGVLYQDLAAQGLVQAGAGAEKFFNDNLKVDVVLETGTANISCIVPIVSQMRYLNGTIQMSFNITGA